MTNRILKCYSHDGTERGIDDCDYFQLELIGGHAKQEGSVTLVSKASMAEVLAYKWYLSKDGYPVAHSLTDNSPAQRSRGFRGIKMHHMLVSARAIMAKGQVVDHINRNRLDNRLENLRICEQRENSYNTSKRSATCGKYKGVHKMASGKFKAVVSKDGRQHVISNIVTEKDAAQMYDIMAEELFGKFAGKNFPDA